MRTIPSRLALIVVLAMAAPALVVHGQQNPEAMPQAGLVRLLAEDKVAFGVTVDARADPVALSANDDIDFVFFDMEHGPYDVSALRTWMQWLVNPAAIAATGDAMAGKAVIVRIPATGRELDQNIWMVKQVLDVGAHGIVFPTVETPEQALMAIRAMRYPQRLGAPDPEPAGLRGTNPRLAARYWGLSVPDYIERADVWRLDPPNGNLLSWLLIESPLGVANVREIARQLSERNIGAVLFAGSETGGDMLNTHGGSLEAVAQAIDTVLAAGKEFGLPVAMTSTTNMMERIEQGARRTPIQSRWPAARMEESGLRSTSFPSTRTSLQELLRTCALWVLAALAAGCGGPQQAPDVILPSTALARTRPSRCLASAPAGSRRWQSRTVGAGLDSTMPIGRQRWSTARPMSDREVATMRLGGATGHG